MPCFYCLVACYITGILTPY